MFQISVIIPFLGNDTYSDFYKTESKSNTYWVDAGYTGTCLLDFSDVFQNSILGVVSVSRTGDCVAGTHQHSNIAFSINNANKTITIPIYGGRGGDTRIGSGIITVTAIGY